MECADLSPDIDMSIKMCCNVVYGNLCPVELGQTGPCQWYRPTYLLDRTCAPAGV